MEEKELKVADSMKMVNDHSREMKMRDQEQQRKQDEFDIEKKNIVKKVKRYGTVAAVAITIAASTLTVKARNLYEINQGRAEIVDEFNEKTPDFNFRDDSVSGPIIGIGNAYYETENEYKAAAETLFETAIENGMSREEAYIGLKGTTNEKTAEEQVVQVLNFDIHLVKDFRGRRYIERVTECIPVEDRNEYTFDYRKEKSLEGKLDKFMDNATVFFTKTTNRELYKYRNIMEYQDGNYVLTNPISEENIKAMRMNMDDSDIQGFDDFLQRNWGIKLQNEEDTNQEEIVQPKKRGRKPKATI